MTLLNTGARISVLGFSLILSGASICCAAGVNSFAVDDDTVVEGAAVTLNWDVDTDLSSVTIEPGIGDVSGLTVNGIGSLVISPGPLVSTTYTLNTAGPAGAISAQVSVTVGDPPDIGAFVAAVDATNPDIRRILSWDVTNATGVEISPNLGQLPVSGVGYYQMVSPGAVWNYLDDGSDLEPDWIAIDYDDGAWANGPAELGYGERDEATVVGYGGPPFAKSITTYFRHAFNRTAVDAVDQLRIGIKYDDGAVVYLNGIEVGRFHLPDGPIEHTTPALGDAPDDANNYEFLVIPAEALREGRNVLAVEIHQSRPSSSDMSFDMMLEGYMDGGLTVVSLENTIYTLEATNDFGSSTAEQRVAVSANPVAAYGFDSANLQDSAGLTSANLEGAQPPVFVQDPHKHGLGAYQFSGDGGVAISGGGLLSALGAEPVGDALSIGFWMKADAFGAAGSTVIDAGIEFSKGGVSRPMDLCIKLPDGQEHFINGVFDDEWHHIGLVLLTGTPVDSGGLRLFRDGVMVLELGYSGGALDLPNEWVLGRAVDGSDGFIGALDDFVVFGRVISSAEFTQLIQDAAVSFLVPEIFVFEADDQTVYAGADVKLSWLALDAETITVSPVFGSVDAIGEAIVRPMESTTYVFTASNPYGSVTRELTVTTGAIPVIHQFSIMPDLISVNGETVDLEWEVSGSTNVVIDQGIGSVGDSGGVEVVVTSLSTYRLTAENDFGINTAVATATVVDEPSAKPWTMVIIPDTQHYSDDVNNASIFTEITNWIVDHRESNDIRFVMQEGDLVNSNLTVEWDRARASIEVLDGQVPYALSTGNNDLGPDGDTTTRVGEFNLATRFGAGSPYVNQTTFSGYYQGTGDPSYRESSYHTFHAAGFDYLVLALEWVPRDEVVEWANRVVEAHPGHRAILVTHLYLSKNSYWSESVGLGGNNGVDLWKKLVRKHENFIMTTSGHAGSQGYLKSLGNQGNTVHQMLFNAQFEDNGGDGWIRLLEFHPDGRTVEVKTFSPHREALGKNAWHTGSGTQFTIELNDFPSVDTDGDHIPDGWESSHGLDPSDPSDAAFDSNGNGLNNLMEYALAGRPFASSASTWRPPLTIEALEDGLKTIQFRRRIPGTSRLNYVLERSTDLSNWSFDPGDGSILREVSVENNGDATETVTVEDQVSLGGEDQSSYYRLRLEAEE